jgi:hypothetical protein
MCGIIDVVGVGLDRMVWVLWMEYAIAISPLSVDEVAHEKTHKDTDNFL